jgi:hypothetical protein
LRALPPFDCCSAVNIYLPDNAYHSLVITPDNFVMNYLSML